MKRDVRDTVCYRDAREFYQATRRPSSGKISDATEVEVSSDGRRAAFVGCTLNDLEGSSQTRIYQIDLITNHVEAMTLGPNNDRSPKYSPDSKQMAVLSDRRRLGDFQLYLLDSSSGAIRATPPVVGWVEYLHWSPDGTQILLGVAGYGADSSTSQGAIGSQLEREELPSWTPWIETGDSCNRWRGVWIYDLRTDRVRKVSGPERNIWEAAWCGNTAIMGVVSPGPREGLWYTAKLEVVNLQSGQSHEAYTPKAQIGAISASDSGKQVAFVEALCSDRSVVAGELRLMETTSGRIKQIDTRGIDITYTEWRSEHRLLLAGHRGFETCVGLYDVMACSFQEVWCSREISSGGRYIAISGFGDSGDCVLIGEGFTKAPEIVVIRAGKYQAAMSFDLGYTQQANAIAATESVTWSAPDGLEIQGWLLRPQAEPPYPLIMNIHGGPVWMWHPMSLARGRYVPLCMLISRGYSVFLPNPRGSSGRGQSFARLVLGDMGGADTYDHLSGIDYLVQRGIADSHRIGVTGVSYGGFMTSWLIGQDARFAAAVPIAAHNNHVTAHLLSNIPDFVKLFFADTYTNLSGKYYERSPILHAHRVKTPTLNICGALDRSAPPEESVQFHRALLENGVKTVLVTYPEEGHGVSKLPATIDLAARVVDWFEMYMTGGQSPTL